MALKIFNDFINVFEPKPIPQPSPEPEPEPIPLTDVKKNESFSFGANQRVALEKKLPAEKPTVYSVLEQLEKLPKPDLTDANSIRSYKQQRLSIAENAIRNSPPPRFEDFLNSGLNGRTAEMHYNEAKSSYDNQIKKLQAVADEARRNPNKIVSPGEAAIRINELPKPDPTDPDSVKNYNDQRARIAKDALMYAKPPKLEDFLNSGLNGATASYEYEQAKINYDSAVRQLEEAVEFEGLTTLLSPEAETAAQSAADRLSDELEDGLGISEEFNGKVASEVKNLQLKYGDEAAAKMMAELYKKHPEDVFISLRLADRMSDYDKQVIGQALGDGYAYLSAEEKADFCGIVAQTTVGDSFTTNVNFGNSQTLAELLKNSSNTQMKTDVVNAMMGLAATIKPGRLGDNGGIDVQALFKSAAIIADSAPSAERAAMLQNIIETLPEVNLPSLIKDNETKDLLSKLFMNSGPEFLHLIAPDGAINNQSIRDGLIKFTELTLFSEGKNSERANLMAYMVELTKDVGDAAAQPAISQTAYENSHGGWSQQDHVEVMSTLMAITWKGAQNQTEAIKADEQQQKETVQMFTGLAFSFVPGAGKVLGELGGEGAVFLEQVAGKVRDFAWDKAQGAVQSGVEGQINKLLSGDSLSNIDSMMSSLRDTVLSLNASLPNGEEGELDLRSKFQSAFTFYQLI